jgi:hypothetical protein
MMSRISDAINLFLLRTGERIDALSPVGKTILVVILILLSLWAARLGIIGHGGRFGRFR